MSTLILHISTLPRNHKHTNKYTQKICTSTFNPTVAYMRIMHSSTHAITHKPHTFDTYRVLRIHIHVQRRQSGLKSGVVGPGKKCKFAQASFREISIFSGKFTKKIDFNRQIFEKFRFFQAMSQNNGFFQANCLKNYDFSGNFRKNSILQAKIGHMQLLLGKLFYFSSKVTTFEHTYIIRYNNISRPSTNPPRPSCPKSGGRDPQPLGLPPLYMYTLACVCA